MPEVPFGCSLIRATSPQHHYLNVMARMEADIESMRTRLFEADPALAP
jgi:hypothetical protein